MNLKADSHGASQHEQALGSSGKNAARRRTVLLGAVTSVVVAMIQPPEFD